MSVHHPGITQTQDRARGGPSENVAFGPNHLVERKAAVALVVIGSSERLLLTEVEPVTSFMAMRSARQPVATGRNRWQQALAVDAKAVVAPAAGSPRSRVTRLRVGRAWAVHGRPGASRPVVDSPPFLTPFQAYSQAAASAWVQPGTTPLQSCRLQADVGVVRSSPPTRR